VPCRDHTSKALRYSMRSQGISQFYLHTPHSSTNGMNHTFLCLPSQSWYSFTDPRGGDGRLSRPRYTKQYNLVPAKRQWRSKAGKVTVGLMMHWPCATDFVAYPPPMGSGPNGEMSNCTHVHGRTVSFTKTRTRNTFDKMMTKNTLWNALFHSPNTYVFSMCVRKICQLTRALRFAKSGK